MSVKCRLLSLLDQVPNLELAVGESIIIGRNKHCKIKELKCSRHELKATFDGSAIAIESIKTKIKKVINNGQFVKGPGFDYQVKILERGELINGDKAISSSENDNCAGESLIESSGIKLEQKRKNNAKVTDEKLESVWKSIKSEHVYQYNFMGGGKPSIKIAAFDFDGTLVDTKSGKTFPINAHDWKLKNNSLPGKIKRLVNDEGYRFVVISNQKGISTKQVPLQEVQQRFEECLDSIGVPCVVLIAAHDDIYRKPRTGLLSIFTSECNDEEDIDKNNSFYVGDAAGRKSQIRGVKSDHSAGDILFAFNAGLPFLTPEQFISGFKAKPVSPEKIDNLKVFNPKNYRKMNYAAVDMQTGQKFSSIQEIIDIYQNILHIVILCGIPASGKSTFHRTFLDNLGYEYVSRDELKTKEKCIKDLKKFLSENKNCVIDNTNIDDAARKVWVNIAQEFSAVPILFLFDVSVEHAIHNNTFRKLSDKGTVTELLIRSMNKVFFQPTMKENFKAIYKISFHTNFGDAELEKLYHMFLNEK